MHAGDTNDRSRVHGDIEGCHHTDLGMVENDNASDNNTTDTDHHIVQDDNAGDHLNVANNSVVGTIMDYIVMTHLLLSTY